MKTITKTFLTFILFSAFNAQSQNLYPPIGAISVDAVKINGQGTVLNFADITTLPATGMTWYAPSPSLYGIYKTAGSWVTPDWQQLDLSFATGIVLDPGTLYGKSYVNVLGNGLRVSSGNVGIGTITPIVGAKLQIETPDGNWGTLLSRSGVYLGGLHANAGILTLQNMNGGLLAFNGANVGIGTTTPTVKLDVVGDVKTSGTLQVTGTILTSRVKVAIPTGTNWNWADYVFVKGYKIKSLNEVESYINANNHLEGVQTSEDVQKDGVDLAQTSAKLLEKIEELTLYMIDLNKKVEVLEKENALLKSK